MSLAIECHRARTSLSRDILDYAKLIRRIFMHNSQCPLAIRGKCESCFWIKAGGVSSRSAGEGGNDVTGVGVNDRHQLVRADGEQAPMLPIYREAAWFFAR